MITNKMMSVPQDLKIKHQLKEPDKVVQSEEVHKFVNGMPNRQGAKVLTKPHHPNLEIKP